ncbi:MAG: hypothetical protein GXO56_00955 [Chloroflexi bacterium]|nr:hypothetical protein [Chloroflexota bacterium]
MNNKTIGCLVGGCLLVLLIIICASIGAAAWIIFGNTPSAPITSHNPIVWPTITPTASPYPTMSSFQLTQYQNVITETLAALEARRVPINDPVDLAHRLEHKTDVWATPSMPPPHQVGDVDRFWVINNDTNENFQVTAQLAYIRPHVYFWVEQGVDYDKNDLKRLVDTFEDKIYPTDRAFFGSEWTPGIDGDPHLYILYARNIGSWVAGYFSSADEVPPFAHEYSNAHEMFVINADAVNLGDTFIYSVLAHEFQHMIHWYHDRNETSWLNEGASELASFINGYGTGGVDMAYTNEPDTQLNAWSDPSEGSNATDYGASFLFMTYFLGRFGEQATRTLIGRPENGLESVDLTLQELGTGMDADDLFVDWTVANWLRDPTLDEGQYGYQTDYRPPIAAVSDTANTCPSGPHGGIVHQYGADYIQIRCDGAHTFYFKGAPTVSLFPTDPHSGKWTFWTGYGDESDMTLTRVFDLRDVQTATLLYWTWYDIEKDYDFVYVEASTDGQNWQILKTPSGSDQDPTGNSYGWGYTGISGNGETPQWIQETVDLTPFAGQRVWIRFEYVTDAAVNHTGFLLDDIRIPEIGYTADLEDGLDGWDAQGFVRVGRWLPQMFRLTMISYDRQGHPLVQSFALDGHNQIQIPFQIGYKPTVFIVSGTTRVTREQAVYSWSVDVPLDNTQP